MSTGRQKQLVNFYSLLNSLIDKVGPKLYKLHSYSLQLHDITWSSGRNIRAQNKAKAEHTEKLTNRLENL
jgi:hypothetical protein